MKTANPSRYISVPRLVGIGFILFLSSCAVPKFALRPDAKIETLSVCLEYSEKVPPKVQANFDSTIAIFVDRFNAEEHMFYLGPCDNYRKCALNIDIKETHLVSKRRQWTSTIVTLVGLSLPIVMVAAEVPFVVFFYSFPNDVSIIELALTSDIAPYGSVLNRNVTNSGYLISERRQIKKHGAAFHYFLKQELNWIEKEYKKQQKKQNKLTN